MASQFELKVYDTELHLKTYYNFFPEDVPVAKDAFAHLKNLFDKSELPVLEFEARKLYVERFVIENDWTLLLFHMTDPSIRDRDYSNIAKGTLRTAERLEGEEPAFSAHVIINTHSSYDQRRSYPCIIEETQSLSRTVIAYALNTFLAKTYDEERERPAKKDKKPYKVKVNLNAPLDQTIEGMLQHGGRLEGIEFSEHAMADVVNGDEAYPVQKERRVKMKVEGRPAGDRARDLLSDVSACGTDLRFS